jgi:acyl-homoserine lactone acylase PvdQ
MKRRLGLLFSCGLLALPAALPSAAQAQDSFSIYNGFHSVLAYGEGENTTAADLAAYEANGTAPASDLNEDSLYEGIEQAWPGITDANLGDFYRDSDFAEEPISTTTSTLTGVLSPTVGDATGAQPTIETPEAGATIVQDPPYDVPQIYGATRADAMFAAGYVTAQKRLFLMDILRHTAEGTTAELEGESAVPADSESLGVADATPTQLTNEMESLPQTEGAEGAMALTDIENYIDGINAYIDQTRVDPSLLPAEYAVLGTTPSTWTLADSAAVGIYLIGQNLVLADNQAQQSEALVMLEEKLGHKRGLATYNDLRQANNPSGVVTLNKDFKGQNLGKVNKASEAMVDPGSLVLRDAQTGLPVKSASSQADLRREQAELKLLPSWAQQLIEHPLKLSGGESNAILVDAKRSGTGQALFVGGPQVDYYTPEIFLEYELHAPAGNGEPAIDVSGIGFPGAAPYPFIGHGIDFAWTGTSAYSSNEDEFAEKLCNRDGSTPSFASTSYMYKGRCVPFTQATVADALPVGAENTEVPTTVDLTTENSVHGPVTYYATVHGAPVAITTANATQGHEVQSYVAFEKLAENEVDSPQSFVSTMRLVTGGENWWYVDDRNIALLQSGWYPLHAKGTNPDFPIWGTGQYDWQDFQPATNSYARLPDSANPTSIDPPDGYLVNWNNQIAHDWPIAAGYWTQGAVVRDSMLNTDLADALKRGPLDLAKLTNDVTAPAATSDLRGEEVWPVMDQVIGKSTNPLIRQLVGLEQAWYKAGGQRRSLTFDGDVEYGPATLLMDTWWPLLVRAEFRPVLGTTIENFINANIDQIAPNGLYDGTSDAFGQGWENDVSEDLHQVLGQKVIGRFSRTYCGGGSLKKCRAVLTGTLLEAYNAIKAKQGGDPTQWVMPTVCKKTTPATCTQSTPTAVGAIQIPYQPFDNRGTFYQAVAVEGHRP